MIYSVLDLVIVWIVELLKTVLIEIHLLSGQIIDDFFALVMYMFFDVKKLLDSGINNISAFSKREKVFHSFNSFFSRKKKNPQSAKKKKIKRKYSLLSSETRTKSLGKIEKTKHIEKEEEENFMLDDAMSVISIVDFMEQERKKYSPFLLLQKLFKNVLKIISLSMFPVLMVLLPQLRTQKIQNSVENSKILVSEKKTTGLFEDFHLKNLEFIEDIGEAWKRLIRFDFSNAFAELKKGFKLYKLKNFISTDNIDERHISTIIKDDGYPVEQLQVETKDGYLLKMERIINKKSKKVIFFQHGIMDSSFCWISNKNRSLAYRSFSRGYDIFLGNFRGNTLGAKVSDTHKNQKIGRKYWDFSINELARYDVGAFIEHIIELKRKELNDPKADIQITMISHSLGCAASLAYLSYSKIFKFDHRISKLICLAPAGCHDNINNFYKLFAKVAMIGYKIGIKYFGITNETLRILFANAAKSILDASGARSFISTFTAAIILGGNSEKSPLNYVSNFVFHIFYGTSMRLVTHLIQLNMNKKFQAFDYGSKSNNKKKYGTEKPYDFMDYYGDIDIPIVFCSGDRDQVIHAYNVRKQYLRAFNDCKYANVHHKYKCFVDSGHIDLTYSISERMILFIEEQLKETDLSKSSPLKTKSQILFPEKSGL